MSKIELYNGDCLEIMQKIENKSIDMILCDLPYGTTQNKDDIIIPFESLWKEYERIIKDNGCIALFGQVMFYVDLVNSNRKMFRYDLIWDKILPYDKEYIENHNKKVANTVRKNELERKLDKIDFGTLSLNQLKNIMKIIEK